MFGRLGTMEIITILAILLFLFGGKKLPELAKGLGSALKELREAAKDDVKEKKD